MCRIEDAQAVEEAARRLTMACSSRCGDLIRDPSTLPFLPASKEPLDRLLAELDAKTSDTRKRK